MTVNQLLIITASDVEPLTNLTTLSLGNNFDLVIENLSPLGDTLLELYIPGCDVEATSSIENVIRNFSMLQTLILSGRNLVNFPDLSTSCSALATVYADNNALESINSSSIDKCTAMEAFMAPENLLTSLPNITAMGQTLKTLILHTNRISELNQDFMRAQTTLWRVEMYNNKLDVFPDLFSSGNRVKTLLLDTNQIPSVDPAVFATLINLESLDLSDNLLTTFPDVPLPLLTSLNLGKNKFTVMPTFTRLGESLIDLQLNHNDIHVIYTNDLSCLRKLETLNLDFTKLSAIPDLQYLSHLISLSLANTPIKTASPRASAHLGKLLTLDLQNTSLVEIPTMCPGSSLTLQLEDSPNLDLCSSKMAWLKQNFFTVTYTDVMCTELGKMWREATFEELLAVHPAPEAGDVNRRYQIPSEYILINKNFAS